MAEAGFDLAVNGTADAAAAVEVLQGVRERGRRACYIQADIANPALHAGVVEQVYAAFGTVDCLVCNAGVQVDHRGDMLNASLASFDRVMSVNLRGTFFLTQQFARRMIAEPRNGADPRRSVVLISSANAQLASPNFAEYCISKAGLAMMTKLLALRLAAENIFVHEVRPGITRSDLSAQNAATYDKLIAAGKEVPLRCWGEAAGLGKAVASLAAGAVPFCTGDVINVDGGMHIPRLIIEYGST
jgi:NAD(P)-dependent dehydrogenase (short-subunit alcohol dehydrogenase family)